jgi:alanine or glycine:cation symporter, AGCS family
MLEEPLHRAISKWVAAASSFVWGPQMLFLLLGAGLLLTIRYRFVQVRLFPEAARTLVPAQQEGARGALSPFQAFMTALGASIGTGNIAGVATAVVTGGPGAVFWIWCYGFFATVIKLTEAMLGIRYRALEGGHVLAGPMYYLRDGLRRPELAWIYALVAGVAALTTTPFTQPNSMAIVLESQFHIPTWASGIGIAVLAWLVIIGGVRSIGRVAEKLAPLKVGLYLAGGLWVILFHAGQVPEVFALIFREAFSLEGAKGGTAGVGVMIAMRYGIARGIYANEAGYGTAAVAYGSARSEQPVQQGLNAVMEVFIVSFVTSTISALTILVSGVWTSGKTSTALVAAAFDTAIPVGGWVVAFCAFLFGYTTLTGWAYYGEQFLEYIGGKKITKPYRWIYCGLIYFGATSKPELVWDWGDLMNGLQVFPNMVGIIGLSGVVVAALRSRHAAAEAPGTRPS